MINIAALDAYDNRILGGVDIDTVHKNPNLKCINVHCWVVSNDGQFVLMQRRSSSQLCHPGKYDISLAGHVDADEQPLETMLREAYEEDAIDLRDKLVTFEEPLYIEEEGVSPDGRRWLHNQYVHLYFAVVDKQSVSVSSTDADVAGFEWWTLETFALRSAKPLSQRLVPHPTGYYRLVIKKLYELHRLHAKIGA